VKTFYFGEYAIHYISAWWLWTISKFSSKKSKKQLKNLEMDNS